MSEQRPTQTPPPPSGRGLQWKTIAWVAVAVYALVFLLLNNDKTDVSFVFFTVETRLVWLILLSMALGALLITLGPRLWRARQDR